MYLNKGKVLHCNTWHDDLGFLRKRGWRPVTSWRPPWRTPAGAPPRSPARSRCPTTSHSEQRGRWDNSCDLVTLWPSPWPRWWWARASAWVWTTSCPASSTCTAAASASSLGSAAACYSRYSGVSYQHFHSVTLIRRCNTSLMKRMTKRRRQALDARKLPEECFLYSLWLL